jgi:DNA adenine methylase
MKYLGGKQRLGKHLSPYLHKVWSFYDSEAGKKLIKLDGYLEPFCGSLGVFKHMTDLIDVGAKTIVANDYHPDLIEMWKAVQNNSLEYPKSISEEEFLEAKKLDSPNAYKAFVGFGMSFGGRFFGSYSQKYLGDKKEDFCKEMVNSLKRTQPLISRKNVYFINKNYQDLNPRGKFIYCDPPYMQGKYPIKYRRDVKYYDVFDNETFWEIMRKWSKDNVVLISEMNAPEDFVEVWNMERYRSAAQSTKTRYSEKSEQASETRKIEKVFMHNSRVNEINDL